MRDDAGKHSQAHTSPEHYWQTYRHIKHQLKMVFTGVHSARKGMCGIETCGASVNTKDNIFSI
jgi:hypothetical protein